MTIPYTKALRAAMALVEKATPGEWSSFDIGNGVSSFLTTTGKGNVYQLGVREIPENAAAIVACFNLVRTYGKAVLGEGWRTMESAPRDGTLVLAHHPEWRRPYLCEWDAAWNNWWTEGGHGHAPKPQPTHWMPLPIPPEPTK